MKPLLYYSHSILLFFFLSHILFAQNIITDRPDQTESPITLEKGRLQIESGILNQAEGEGSDALKSLIIPTNLFRYGISNKVELRMVLQLDGIEVYGDETYQFELGHVELGAKTVLNQTEDSKVQIALLSHLQLPKRNWSHFEDQLGFFNRISIAHNLTQKSSIGYNFGYNHYARGEGNLIYTLAIGHSITEKLSIYFEPYGSIFSNSTPLFNFDYGFTYLIHSNLQLDLSFGQGLNDDMNYQSFGISWRQKAKEKISPNP